jgi:hypothetical protein
MKYVCPVCGYDGLDEEPWSDGSPSDEICPSCGIHFGYDDAAGGDPHARQEIYATWRQRWLAAAMPWSSRGRPVPADWDPQRQLRRVT